MSQPQGRSAAGRVMSMKNSNDTIGNRTRNLLACSEVPQPTAPIAACPVADQVLLERFCATRNSAICVGVMPPRTRPQISFIYQLCSIILATGSVTKYRDSLAGLSERGSVAVLILNSPPVAFFSGTIRSSAEK